LRANQWGHAVINAETIKSVWPTSHNGFKSAHEVFYGQAPLIKQFRKFGCKVSTPIYEKSNRRGTFKVQMKDQIYVGHHSADRIKCLDPWTGHVTIHRFKDCYFNETVFPSMKVGTHGNFSEGTGEDPSEDQINHHVESTIGRNRRLELDAYSYMVNEEGIQSPAAVVDTVVPKTSDIMSDTRASDNMHTSDTRLNKVWDYFIYLMKWSQADHL
jgi:hypothetical protein